MCGLTAFYATDSAITIDEATLRGRLEDSIASIGHRGPDSAGFYVSPDARVGLGHARLSIIDLNGGQQPLCDADQHIHAVVNGELYDYASIRANLEAKGARFKTNSDSELVIHLYRQFGVNMLTFLRGEFSFVLFDSKRDWLFAARDRFGIKPLYYTFFNGNLLLASEMKAFRSFNWCPEWDVESIVQMGDYNDDRTIFKRVFKVPAGSYLILRRTSQLKIQSFWDHSHPSPSTPETRTVDEMVQGVRTRLVDSVRMRLRSDVPLGVYLSGGIDSAAIAGIAATLLREREPSARLASFTLSFPNRPDLDEGPIARRMAEFIDADAHMVMPSERDLVDLFERSVWHAEQPIFTLHGAGKIFLSNFVREKGYKVVLTGEGADEIFGGYSFLLLDYLRAVDSASRDLNLPLPDDATLKVMLEAMEGIRQPQDHISISDMSFTDSKQGRAMMGGISAHRVWGMSGVPKEIFNTRTIERFGLPDHARTVAEGLDARAREKARSGQWHPLDAGLYAITKTMLNNGILNYVGERAEMASSIEGRPPFLDHVLVDYADSLPPSVKILPSPDSTSPQKWVFTEKWILRQAVKPFVTDELFARKKSQYNVPISKTVPKPSLSSHSAGELTPLQLLLKEGLTRESVESLGWANWEYMEGLLESYLMNMETPVDGGLDKRARVLLCVFSFVILQRRFHVPTARV